MMTGYSQVDLALIAGILAFAVCVILLDLNDITLPRGDSVSMSGALVAAAVVVLGWPAALFVGMSGVLLNWASASRQSRRVGFISRVVVRLTSTLGAAALALLIAETLGRRSDGAASLLVPFVYLAIELATQQVAVSLDTDRRIVGIIKGSFGRQAPIAAAELSASILVLVTYPGMGLWALIPVVALLLLIKQAWGYLLNIRNSYRETVTVLVEAAVAQNPDLDGHAQRTATIARRIGARLGLSSRELERLSYAALLHDIDTIHEMNSMESAGSARASADVVRDVNFLRDVIPPLQVSDGRAEMNAEDESALVIGFLVTIASFADTIEYPVAKRLDEEELARRVSLRIPRRLKSRVAAAALDLGYEIPALA